jgi:hypothetical protein
MCLTYPLAFALAPGVVVWHAAFCHNASLAAASPLSADDFEDLERRWNGRWQECTSARVFRKGTAQWWRSWLARVERTARVYQEADVASLGELLARQSEALEQLGLPPDRRERVLREAETIVGQRPLWHEGIARAVHLLAFHPSVFGEPRQFAQRCALFAVGVSAWTASMAAAARRAPTDSDVDTAVALVGHGYTMPALDTHRFPELHRLQQCVQASPKGSWLRRAARGLLRRASPGATRVL